jgi:hypothetical protein
MASGAKYANGNYKAQQKAYNKTKHGLKIRVAANKADRRSKANGTGKKGDGKDNSHINANKTVLAKASTNRAGLGIHKRRKARTT